jgi:beta-glucosidase
MLRALATMLSAHAAAYEAIKRIKPNSQVGICHHLRHFAPHRPASPLDRWAAGLRHGFFNVPVLEALHEGALRLPGAGRVPIAGARGALDFIGVNYYFGEATAFDLRRPMELFTRSVLTPLAEQLRGLFAGMGNVDPNGLERLLCGLARYGKPIYITENGVFAAAGLNQASYLEGHLAAVQRAIQQGAPVRGYFWWTLVDNFEWADGYGPRYGLYHLDRETQARTARAVAAAYAGIIRRNGLGLEARVLAGGAGQCRAAQPDGAGPIELGPVWAASEEKAA